MKFFVAAFLTFASSVALAFPAVGDMAVYEGLFTTPDGNKIEFETTQELISYNAATDSFVMRITSTAGGSSDTQEAEILRDQLIDRARVSQIVRMCELINGGQTIILPVGTFPSCSNKLTAPGDKNTYYFGVVPFGLVMSDEHTDSGQVTKVLKSYRHGN